MKKLFLLVIAAAINSSTFCQVNTNNEQKSIASLTYRLKARKQKTAAWLLLGGGATLFTTAMLTGAGKASDNIITLSNDPQHSYVAETVLATVGGAAMICSIPFFVNAAHNKFKARLKMTEQKTAVGLPISAPKKIPSFTLAISI